MSNSYFLTFDDFYQTFQKLDMVIENQPSANILSKSNQAVSKRTVNKSLAQDILTEEFSSEVDTIQVRSSNCTRVTG